jgi:hypothetical protein
MVIPRKGAAASAIDAATPTPMGSCFGKTTLGRTIDDMPSV